MSHITTHMISRNATRSCINPNPQSIIMSIGIKEKEKFLSNELLGPDLEFLAGSSVREPRTCTYKAGTY